MWNEYSCTTIIASIITNSRVFNNNFLVLVFVYNIITIIDPWPRAPLAHIVAQWRQPAVNYTLIEKIEGELKFQWLFITKLE